MAWMTQLCKTYDNLLTNEEVLKGCKMPLLPLSHTLQNAHVEIVVDENGDFIQAYEISKENSPTIVPCTEDSAARGNGILPHMLYDNLKYVAKDAYKYKADKKLRSSYEAYCEQLGEWCDRADCPDDVRAIYQYVSRGSVIADLLKQAVLTMKNDKLAWGGTTDNKPAGDILSTFVRFKVRHRDGTTVECNENTVLMDAYEKYAESRYTDIRLCFVSGERKPVTYKHPSKIRYGGDSAKLISSNDESGYTYRGRFHNKEDAFAVSYEVTQKAHSALRWLIANQGFATGPQTVIVWSVGAKDKPPLYEDTFSLYSDEDEMYDAYTPLDIYADNVRKAVGGYRHTDFHAAMNANNIVVMIVESATTGRLSITYYREFSDVDYFDNIEYWHRTCVWNHSYKIKKREIDQEDGTRREEIKRIKFTGAPSVSDIISAAYGKDVNDKLKKHLTEILVSCIADRRKLPRDIMMKAVERASNAAVFENWEIEKITSIACALVRKYYFDKFKEEYDMALDYENRDRSYLFGRVLAYAERIESYALFKAGEKRVPNARKLRSKFRTKPAGTLLVLDGKLEPYVESLYANSGWMYSQMQDVIALISPQDFNDAPLDATYLLGYSCQMAEFAKKNEAVDEENEDNE